jgi:hypothetical protein
MGILWACYKKESDPLPITPELNYFLEIAFGNEFGEPYQAIRKWENNLKVYLPETQYTELNGELDKIIQEINTLSKSIKISKVESETEANFIIYFGSGTSYASTYEPNASSLVASNWGLFYIYWNNQYKIYKGSMYVDVTRATESNCQKHLLREELTQALGLMNDSYQSETSIFYQRWTCYPAYNELDKQVIQSFLSSKIQAGMTKTEVINIWQGI